MKITTIIFIYIMEAIKLILLKAHSMTDQTFLKKIYRSFSSLSSYRGTSLSFVLITYGTGQLFLNGTRYPIKRGSLCFLTPFDCFLFESTQDNKLQAWIVEFSLDFMFDFLSDPFIDPYTYQVLREKNGIVQLDSERTVEFSTMIEDLLPEPRTKNVTEYLHNRTTLRFIFAAANSGVFYIKPRIGGDK